MIRHCRSILLLVTAVAAAPGASLETGKAIPIWPGAVPGESGNVGAEHDTSDAKSPLIAGKSVVRLTDVSVPTITVYPAPRGKNTGAVMLVFPGGGYSILALDLEGTEVCEWLNSIGVTGVLLKYRVPARAGSPRALAPLQDAQRTMGLARLHAREWGGDPARVGAMGFSAGAHLTAALSNHYEKRAYDAVDEADQLSCRPDFAGIIYPGLLTEKNDGKHLAADMTVTAKTPPSFIAQAEDDPVHVENSILYYMALKEAGVPAEMHLFAQGKHGYGLRGGERPIATKWPVLEEQWLRSLGVLKSR